MDIKYVPSTRLTEEVIDGQDHKYGNMAYFELIQGNIKEITDEQDMYGVTPIAPTDYTITIINKEQESQEENKLNKTKVTQNLMYSNICLMAQQYEETNMKEKAATDWTKSSSITNDVFGRTISFLNMFLNGQITEDTTFFIKLQMADPKIGKLYTNTAEELDKQDIVIENDLVFKTKVDKIAKLETKRLMIPEALIQSLIRTIHDKLNHPTVQNNEHTAFLLNTEEQEEKEIELKSIKNIPMTKQ